MTLDYDCSSNSSCGASVKVFTDTLMWKIPKQILTKRTIKGKKLPSRQNSSRDLFLTYDGGKQWSEQKEKKKPVRIRTKTKRNDTAAQATDNKSQPEFYGRTDWIDPSRALLTNSYHTVLAWERLKPLCLYRSLFRENRWGKRRVGRYKRPDKSPHCSWPKKLIIISRVLVCRTRFLTTVPSVLCSSTTNVAIQSRSYITGFEMNKELRNYWKLSVLTL